MTRIIETELPILTKPKGSNVVMFLIGIAVLAMLTSETHRVILHILDQENHTDIMYAMLISVYVMIWFVVLCEFIEWVASSFWFTAKYLRNRHNYIVPIYYYRLEMSALYSYFEGKEMITWIEETFTGNWYILEPIVLGKTIVYFNRRADAAMLKLRFNIEVK